MPRKRHVFSTPGRARTWSRFEIKTKMILCAGYPDEFERLCDARDALGVNRISDAIRLMVDKTLEDADRV